MDMQADMVNMARLIKKMPLYKGSGGSALRKFISTPLSIANNQGKRKGEAIIIMKKANLVFS